MTAPLRLSMILLLAAGCQLVTGLSDLEIVATSQGAGPQAGAPGGGDDAGGAFAGGDAPGGAGGAGAAGGVPGTLLIHDFQGPNQPLSMAQNDDALFFSDSDLGPGQGRIWRWQKGAVAPAEVIVQNEESPTNVWATSTRLYWSAGAGPFDLVRAELSDIEGTREVIDSAAFGISDVAVDGDGTELFVADGSIRVAGGASLYSGAAFRLDVRDPIAIFAVANDIVRVPKDGGPADTILGGGKGGYFGVTTDATNVFAIAVSGLVARVDKDGTNPDFELVNLMPAGGRDIAADDATDDVYFASTDGIGRLPKTGGAATIVATGPAPSALLIDADSIYWFDANDADVWRTPR